jgi:sugar lactone lactonase YvrE
MRPRVAVACGCALGEGPIWDARIDTLHWVDIEAGALFSWRPATDAEPHRRTFGEPLGFVQLTADPDRVLLGLKSGLAFLSSDDATPAHALAPEPDRPRNRINDGAVGPDGSLYFGTMDMDEAEPTGSFYRWSEAGLARFGQPAYRDERPGDRRRARRPLRGGHGRPTRVPPRPGLRRASWRARAFVTFDEGAGHPDGITIDADGHVWICHWGGSRVTRFSPTGEALLEVPMPTAQVTKAAFGGPDLATLYITTAATGHDREIDLHAGHLFSVQTGIRGLPALPCTVRG